MSLPGAKDVPIGAVITTPGSSLRYKTGGWRVFKPVINHEKCVGCRTCFLLCPDAAVEEVEEGGKRKYVVNYEYCKGCGICAAECPVKAIEMVEEVK